MALIRNIVRTLCLLWLMWWSPVHAAGPDKLVIGVFAYRPIPVMEATWAPLGTYLQDRLHGPQVIVRFLTQDQMQEAIAKSELDLVFTNPVHYIMLRSGNRLSGAIATQQSLENGQAVAMFGGVIVKRRDRTDIQTLADLAHKTVAIPRAQSMGAYTAQAALLLDNKVPLDRIQFKELGQPQDNVVAAVLAGKADAGFLRTGVLESSTVRRAFDTSQLEVIAPRTEPGFPFALSTKLYPEWPIVALPHVPPDISRHVTAALLAMEPSDAAAQAAGIYGFTIPADYSDVENTMRLLRMPPFEVVPQLSLADFASQHSWTFAFALLSLGLMVALILRGAWHNQRLHRASITLERTLGELDQEHKRLNNIISSTHAGTWEWNRKTGEVQFSERWATMLGYSRAEIEPLSFEKWVALTHPDDVPGARQQMRRHFAGEIPHYDAVFRMKHKDGHWTWIHTIGMVIQRERGTNEPELITGMHLDVSTQKRQEEERILSHTVFRQSHDGIMITDCDNRIVQVNPAFTQITGYTPDEVMGRSPRILSSGQHDKAFYQALWAHLHKHDTWHGEVWNRHKSGHVYPERISMSLVRDAQGMITHHIAVFSDISLQKRLIEELQYSAYHDRLTGLPNRNLLQDRLKQALSQARRADSGVAVLFADLDGFKPVNDMYGHQAGDELLRTLSTRMNDVLREGDTLARVGGDEFIGVMSGITDTEGAELVANRLLNAIAQPVTLTSAGALVQVSASIGVVLCAGAALQHTESPDALLDAADETMYLAKRAGKGCVRIQTWAP